MGIISKLRVTLGLDSSEYKKGLSTAEKQTKTFSSKVGQMGAAIGAALGLKEILSFGKELVLTASKAEGVERAFKRIGGEKYFQEMKIATKGTISEFELMQRTVLANKLGLPLQDLSKLFSYATETANETGQSVDYLVNSIVTGIGRKSPLILDNLGISAIQLKKEMNGVSMSTASVGQVAAAVGRIANKNLSEMGVTASTAGQKIATLSANWENLKISIGKVISKSSFFNRLMAEMATTIKGITADKASKSIEYLTYNLGLFAKTAEEKKKMISDALTSNQVQIDKLVKKEQGLANLRSKVFQDEKGRLDPSKVTAWAKSRLKHSEDYLQLLKIEKAFKKMLAMETDKQQQKEKAGQVTIIRNIEFLNKQLKEKAKEQQTATGNRLISINNEITALKKEISVLKDMKFVAGSIKPIDLTGKGIKKLDKIPLPEFEKQQEATPLELESSYAKEAQALYLNDLKITQYELDRTIEATAAYGSMLGSVGSIAQSTGNNTIATFANMASSVITSVSKIIPVLFNQAVASSVAGAAAAPWFMAPAIIAANVATVIGAFSGIGGGSASTSASPVTKIDTRQYKDPVINTRRKNTNGMQNIQVEVVGKISNRDIALSAKKGQQQINR